MNTTRLSNTRHEPRHTRLVTRSSPERGTRRMCVDTTHWSCPAGLPGSERGARRLNQRSHAARSDLLRSWRARQSSRTRGTLSDIGEHRVLRRRVERLVVSPDGARIIRAGASSQRVAVRQSQRVAVGVPTAASDAPASHRLRTVSAVLRLCGAEEEVRVKVGVAVDRAPVTREASTGIGASAVRGAAA